jgi:hypothetical protein
VQKPNDSIQPAIADQPVSDIQLNQLKIEWVPHGTIKPNRYNPNTMSYHERMLLRQSLLEDGWTQPVVTLPDRTIVDGEQRWTTAGLPLKPEDIDAVIQKMEKRRGEGAVISESIMTRLDESKRRLQAAIAEGLPPTLASITGGLVPITRLDLGDDAHKMISTIRHNRARGAHQIDAMAGITQDLVHLGLDFDDLETRLGMDHEEINRFLRSAESQADELATVLATGDEDFSPAWAPVHVTTLDSQAANVAASESATAAADSKAFEQQELARRTEIAERAKEVIAQRELSGKPLTQGEKSQVVKEVAAALPAATLTAPKPTEIKRFAVFLSPDDYATVMRVLGETQTARVLVALCRKEERRTQTAATAKSN